MARYSNVQTDFSGGLISEYVLGRTDIKRVANSGRKFKNFFPSLQGPAIYRTGFKHYNTLDPDVEDVLTVDVILATDVPYRVVFSPNQLNIYDSTGVLKDTVLTEYSTSDIKDLRFSSETGELYIAHGRHKPKKLTADITFVSLGLTSEDGKKLYAISGYGVDTTFGSNEGYLSGPAADSGLLEGPSSTGSWQVDPTTGKISTSGDYKTIRTTSRVTATSAQVVLLKAQFDFGSGTLTNDPDRMFTFSLMDIADYPVSGGETNHYNIHPNVSFTAKFVDNKLQLFNQANTSAALAEMNIADIAGDTLEAEIKLNVGSTAANTGAVVTLRSITDTTEVSHTQTGVPTDFYTALLADGVKAFYQSGQLTDGGINPLSVHNIYFRNQTTHGSAEDVELRANAEVQGDDQWSLTDLSFDVEPFLEKEPETNKFNISQNERYITLTSSASDFTPIVNDFNSLSLTNFSPASTTYGDGLTLLTYVDRTQRPTSTTSGTGATFTFVVDAVGNYTVTVTNSGTGYAVGDEIVIDGDDVGGNGVNDDITFNISATPGSYSKDWYVEYNVDGDKFLGKAVHLGSSPNYTLIDPTDTVISLEPVVSVLNIEDNAAQLFLLDNEEATTVVDTKALTLDGVEDDNIQLRSDTIVFNAGFVDSWVRVGDDRRNNQVVVGQDRSLTRWVKIKEHLGTSDHPVDFFRGGFDNSLYSSGSVYRVFGSISTSTGNAFILGPNTSGTINQTMGIIQEDGNRTFSFVNRVQVNKSTDGTLFTGSTTVGNLSTQKQFDVVSCYNNTDDGVPKVEEYVTGTNGSGSLISPPVSSTLTITPVANDAFLNSTEDTFKSEDLGRHVFGRMESGNVFMKIVRFVSTRQAVVKLINEVPRDKRTLAFENGGNFEDVKLGAWYTENYPRTVAKFEQRRIFGGTYNNPNFIYFSRVDDEPSFQPTQNDGDVLDTDAITYALSNKNAGIRWINAAKDLVIGTTGGIYRIVPNQYQYGISPKTVRMELTEEEPCELQAETVASSVFYPDQSGTRLMEYKYDQSLNSSSSNDVSKLVYPIFLTDAIAQIAYQHTPQPRIWARTQSGKIYCLSYHRQEEFYAWSEQDLGADAKVLDISILHRGTETQLDQVWIIVKRDGFIYTEALAETDPVQLTDFPMLDSYIEIDTDKTVVPTYTPFTGSYTVSNSMTVTANEETYGNGGEFVNSASTGFRKASIDLSTPIPLGTTVEIKSTVVEKTGTWRWEFLTATGDQASSAYQQATAITGTDTITTTAEAAQLVLRSQNSGTLKIADITVKDLVVDTGAVSVDVSERFGAGDTVSVLEHGVYIGDQTLTDGTITPQSVSSTKFVVGLRYSGELQMMFPTWDGQNKPAYGATARIVSIRPFLINTWNYMVGVGNKFETVRVSTTYGHGNGFTGFDKERPVAGSTFGVENVPTIKHEEPYPLTIASLTTKTDLN